MIEIDSKSDDIESTVSVLGVPASRLSTRSRYRGLSWDKTNTGWRVRIYYNRKQRHVGRYPDDVTAARAYDKAAVYLYGPSALTNFGYEACLQDATEVSPHIVRAKHNWEHEQRTFKLAQQDSSNAGGCQQPGSPSATKQQHHRDPQLQQALGEVQQQQQQQQQGQQAKQQVQADVPQGHWQQQPPPPPPPGQPPPPPPPPAARPLVALQPLQQAIPDTVSLPVEAGSLVSLISLPVDGGCLASLPFDAGSLVMGSSLSGTQHSTAHWQCSSPPLSTVLSLQPGSSTPGYGGAQHSTAYWQCSSPPLTVATAFTLQPSSFTSGDGGAQHSTVYWQSSSLQEASTQIVSTVQSGSCTPGDGGAQHSTAHWQCDSPQDACTVATAFPMQPCSSTPGHGGAQHSTTYWQGSPPPFVTATLPGAQASSSMPGYVAALLASASSPYSSTGSFEPSVQEQALDSTQYGQYSAAALAVGGASIPTPLVLAAAATAAAADPVDWDALLCSPLRGLTLQ